MTGDEPDLLGDEVQDLLQFFDRCPIGLISFRVDGSVVHINPEAVNLLAPLLGQTDVSNVFTLFGSSWADLESTVAESARKRHGTGGRLVEDHRLASSRPSGPKTVSLALVQVDVDSFMLTATDVSAISAVEAALRESEDRLRAVFDSIDEGYCVCEMIVDDVGQPVDYRFLEVNPLFETMTGLTDPVGRTAYELVPELEQEWVLTYAKVGLGRETLRLEQGSEAMGRWFDIFAVPIEPHGRFAIVFRDQTQRRAAEEALRESEERFRVMTDQLPLLVWVHNADGGQEWVNSTFCEFFGVAREDMRDDRWQMLTHPEDGDAYAQAFADAVSARVAFHDSTRARRADGQWRWVESWAQPRFDPAGEYIGHLGTSADITERVEAEAATSNSERFTRRVLDNLFAFVGVMLPDGTLIEANAAPLRAAGVEPDEVLGRKFWDCYWWSYSPDIQARLQSAVVRAADGETIRYDVPIRVLDDERLWIDFQLAPLRDDRGTITHLVPSGHDLTERITAEQQVVDALDLERIARRRVEVLEASASNLARAATVHDVAQAALADLELALDLELAELYVLGGKGIETFVSPRLSPGASQSTPPAGAPNDVTSDGSSPGSEAISTNSPVMINTPAELSERFPMVGADGSDRVRSVLALPLRATAGHAIGALVVGATEAGWTAEATYGLIESLAGQIGQALERAQLHQQVVEARDKEHDIALRLQRALLPDSLVEHPNLTFAARYLAAADLMAVGGDWYDTLAWPDDRIALTVGDVVGHDLGAATTMGRLRAGVAAVASIIESTPKAVLDAYDRCARRENRTFATAACVVVDAGSGKSVYSLAGHPPPLLISPRGTVSWLDEKPSPPIGSDVGSRTETSFTLEEKSTIVLYSDGLIERRDETIDEGMKRLAESARRHAFKDVEDIADGLVSDLTADTGIADDIIVLCAHWDPGAERFRRRFRAETGELAPLRAELRAWLATHGVEAALERDIVLAVGEGVANAIEHAYVDSDRGFVAVRIDAVEDRLMVVINDQGVWRSQQAEGRNGGRGTAIMEATAQHYDRKTTVAGTSVTLHFDMKPGSGSGRE